MIILKLLQQSIVDPSPLLIQMVKLKAPRVLLLETKPLMLVMLAFFLKEQKQSIVKMMANILMMLLYVNVSFDNKSTVNSTFYKVLTVVIFLIFQMAMLSLLLIQVLEVQLLILVMLDLI